MKRIRIYFTDFWNKDFDVKNNFIYQTLSTKYGVILDEQHPDYLFFSCFGNKHLQYENCIKIFYTGENCVPDFNLCDYAIGFDHLDFGDRYFRLPLFVIYNKFSSLYNKKIDNEGQLLNRKFCNFIYSNNYCADPFRVHFFKELSKYKQIDSGGKAENNIGFCVENKLDFISNYKFTIAFENSSFPGYTTEKIIEPMLVDSLPIYWGNPALEKDFNTESVVWVKDYNDMDRAIQEIIRLDNDDNAYLEKIKETWLLTDIYKNWEEILLQFFDNIFIQDTEQAYRRPKYGFLTNNYLHLIYNCNNTQEKEKSTIKSELITINKVFLSILKHLRLNK